MVLVIYHSLNAPWSRSVFKLIRLNIGEHVLKRYVATETVSQEVIQGLESSVSVSRKPSKPPFVKNLFLGVFDKDVLLYPEMFTIEHLDLFNKSLGPIEQYFKEKGKSNLVR